MGNEATLNLLDGTTITVNICLIVTCKDGDGVYTYVMADGSFLRATNKISF